MKTSTRFFCAFVLLAAGGSALAEAPHRHASDDTVVMSAMRKPASKSYRRMLDGAALFEQRRNDLAPGASLRFKLIPRKLDASLKDVQLKVEADSVVIPLKVAPDQTFTVERNRTALEENADVTPNRKAGTMTWRADVRTPGLPPNVRRLGDLRLECEVGMEAGLISNYPRGFLGWLDTLIVLNPSYCLRPLPRYLFFADRPIWSVTLVDGERREVLTVDMLYAGATRYPEWKKDRYCDCEALFDRTYFVPLGDTSWPDDTLVVLEYVEPAAANALDIDGSTKADVRAAFGEGTVIDFPSGYDVWVYRGRPPSSSEFVLLFEPSGLLARTRVR